MAPLNTLAEYVLPLVKVGGAFLAYKGKIGDEEKDARGAISELGGRIAKIDKYVLAGEYERSFVLIEKIKPTPTKYPRGQNKPRILPL